MRRIIFLILFFVICSLSIKAQLSDSILGSWKFKDVYSERKDNDTSMLAFSRTLFANTTFIFQKDKSYFILSVGRERGIWSLNNDTKILKLSSGIGDSMEAKIVKLVNDTLLLQFYDGELCMFEKGVLKSD